MRLLASKTMVTLRCLLLLTLLERNLVDVLLLYYPSDSITITIDTKQIHEYLGKCSVLRLYFNVLIHNLRNKLFINFNCFVVLYEKSDHKSVSVRDIKLPLFG